MSEAMNAKMPVFRVMETLNDELHIVRQLLNRPQAFAAPEVMDLLRMAVDSIHGRYESLGARVSGEFTEAENAAAREADYDELIASATEYHEQSPFDALKGIIRELQELREKCGDGGSA